MWHRTGTLEVAVSVSRQPTGGFTAQEDGGRPRRWCLFHSAHRPALSLRPRLGLASWAFDSRNTPSVCALRCQLSSTTAFSSFRRLGFFAERWVQTGPCRPIPGLAPEAAKASCGGDYFRKTAACEGGAESGPPVRRFSMSCAATASKSARTRARGMPRGGRRACHTARAGGETD